MYCHLIDSVDYSIAKSAREYELGEEFTDDWWWVKVFNRIHTMCTALPHSLKYCTGFTVSKTFLSFTLGIIF